MFNGNLCSLSIFYNLHISSLSDCGSSNLFDFDLSLLGNNFRMFFKIGNLRFFTEFFDYINCAFLSKLIDNNHNNLIISRILLDVDIANLVNIGNWCSALNFSDDWLIFFCWILLEFYFLNWFCYWSCDLLCFGVDVCHCCLICRLVVAHGDLFTNFSCVCCDHVFVWLGLNQELDVFDLFHFDCGVNLLNFSKNSSDFRWLFSKFGDTAGTNWFMSCFSSLLFIIESIYFFRNLGNIDNFGSFINFIVNHNNSISTGLSFINCNDHLSSLSFFDLNIFRNNAHVLDICCF